MKNSPFPIRWMVLDVEGERSGGRGMAVPEYDGWSDANYQGVLICRPDPIGRQLWCLMCRLLGTIGACSEHTNEVISPGEIKIEAVGSKRRLCPPRLVRILHGCVPLARSVQSASALGRCVPARICMRACRDMGAGDIAFYLVSHIYTYYHCIMLMSECCPNYLLLVVWKGRTN